MNIGSIVTYMSRQKGFLNQLVVVVFFRNINDVVVVGCFSQNLNTFTFFHVEIYGHIHVIEIVLKKRLSLSLVGTKFLIDYLLS